MPYLIQRDGNQFCVHKKQPDGSAGDRIACHEMRRQAIAQIAAILISERKRAGMAAFTLDGAVWQEDGLVYRAGKLFEAGDYPDKQFAITPEELAAAVEGFEPVALGLEHVPTVLDGKLGTLEYVTVEGAELFGVTAWPAWLDALLGDEERKVSGEFDRETKQFCGLHLVRSPRVTDAALMAAFTADAKPPKEAGIMATLWERVKAAFGAASVPDELQEELRVALEGGGEAKPEAGRDPAIPAAFAARFTAMEQALQAERDARTADWAAGVEREAERFADEQIKGARALPAERPSLVAAFRQSALDDRQHPATVTFGVQADGSPLSGSRLDALRATYAARQPHDLLRELMATGLPDGAAVLPGYVESKRAAMSDERRGQLLGLTELGRAALREKGER